MKRQKQSYACLTLFKQDISEIIQLFQNHLKDVEVLIDGLPLLDIAQLQQFDQDYQAKSLLVRGYNREVEEQDLKFQGERLLVELKINNIAVTLLDWREDDETEPEILVQIRKVLLRCHNLVLGVIVLLEYWLFSFLVLALWVPLQLHDVNFLLQIFLSAGSGMLLILAAVPLFAFITRLLKIETLVFLFPGATRPPHFYGWREVVGRLIITVLILVVFFGSIAVAFHLLWR